MITVIGIFQNKELAEEAASYLLANDFEPENVDVHQADEKERVTDFFNHLFNKKEAIAHINAALNGTIITVHAQSVREAQEAVDVFNNSGGIDVSIPGSRAVLSRIVEKIVATGKRLK